MKQEVKDAMLSIPSSEDHMVEVTWIDTLTPQQAYRLGFTDCAKSTFSAVRKVLSTVGGK